MKNLAISLCLAALAVNFCFAGDAASALAPTPPMGWNSWNWFGKQAINEQIVREVIDATSTNGLRDAGYNYVVVDGGWRANHLGPNGELLADPVKFPHGMKSLADYAHSKGFKFGLHTVPGNFDCGCDPVGGYGHEAVQIAQFVAWGLDFIKLDKCRFKLFAKGDYHEANNGWNDDLLKATYSKWHDLLAHCGRPIVLSMSAYQFYDWYPKFGQMGRTTEDIGCRIHDDVKFDGAKGSVMIIADQNNAYAAAAGSGYWNDPDMLVIGEQGLSPDEQQTHFALWCIMSAPLILGNDPRNMTVPEGDLIMNAEAIAVDQDPTEQGRRIKQEGGTEVWAKKLKDGRRAVLLLNRNATEPRTVTLNLKQAQLPEVVSARDVFEKKNLGVCKSTITQTLAPHACVFLLLTGAFENNNR
jgi:alpha-galactosidase